MYMRMEFEIKKISVDPSTLSPELTVSFTLSKYDDMKQFKKELTSFQNKLTGQKELKYDVA